MKKITALEVKKGDVLIEGGGATFPVLDVYIDSRKTTHIKIDTSDYYLSMGVTEKEIYLKEGATVMIVDHPPRI